MVCPSAFWSTDLGPSCFRYYSLLGYETIEIGNGKKCLLSKCEAQDWNPIQMPRLFMSRSHAGTFEVPLDLSEVKRVGWERQMGEGTHGRLKILDLFGTARYETRSSNPQPVVSTKEF